METKTSAVENDVTDRFLLRALGDRFADPRGGVGIGLRRVAESGFGGIGRSNRLAGLVVDDLGVNVPAGEMNGQARPLSGAGDLLADALVAHGRDSFAIHVKVPGNGYW